MLENETSGACDPDQARTAAKASALKSIRTTHFGHNSAEASSAEESEETLLVLFPARHSPAGHAFAFLLPRALALPAAGGSVVASPWRESLCLLMQRDKATLAGLSKQACARHGECGA